MYGATKFAVTGLAESLECELRGRGIRVTLVEPGLVRSEFAQVSGTPLARFTQVPSRSPEEVAGAIVEAVAGDRWKCVPDRLASAAIALRRHLPRLARWGSYRVLRRLRSAGDR